jgi:hypothetical protein
VREQGVDTLFEPESSGGDDEEEDKDEEEVEVTPPPHSPPLEDLPSLGDLFSRHTGVSVGAHWPEQSQMVTGQLTGLPPQSGLALVSSDL